MDKVKALVSQATSAVESGTGGGAGAEEGGGFVEDMQGRLSLSRKHKLIGFGVCLGLGIFLLFVSTTMFVMPTNFAFTYTIANILLMGSTTFLIGPIRQLKLMFDPTRICATVVYLSSLVLALFCAMKLHNFILTIFAIIIEAFAIAWYSLSYIPFARSMVKTTLGSCFPRLF